MTLTFERIFFYFLIMQYLNSKAGMKFQNNLKSPKRVRTRSIYAEEVDIWKLHRKALSS